VCVCVCVCVCVRALACVYDACVYKWCGDHCANGSTDNVRGNSSSVRCRGRRRRTGEVGVYGRRRGYSNAEKKVDAEALSTTARRRRRRERTSAVVLRPDELLNPGGAVGSEGIEPSHSSVLLLPSFLILQQCWRRRRQPEATRYFPFKLVTVSQSHCGQFMWKFDSTRSAIYCAHTPALGGPGGRTVGGGREKGLRAQGSMLS
jgi:hypothetical protein